MITETEAWGPSVCVWRWPLCRSCWLTGPVWEEGVVIAVRKSEQDILFKLKSLSEHSHSHQCFLCWWGLICWSQEEEKLHAGMFAVRSKHLTQAITLPVGSLFPGRGRRTRRSVALALLAVAGEKDHNIISRQEGTRWRNMHEAEGHRAGVNIYTSAASQNDWLPQRTCCEKSIQRSQPSYPPPSL